MNSCTLAHDLGHPPFAHAGEDELAGVMASWGGFDHNVQTVRVCIELEQRYPAFPGLNLTWETLEGVVKHNGPVVDRLDEPALLAVAEYNKRQDLRLNTYASAEAQIAALSDDIAYNNHDVDDGLQAGLFTLADLMDVPLIGPILHATRRDWPGLDDRLVRLEAVRRMIGAMVDDVMAETCRRAVEAKVKSAEDVRLMDRALVAFSRPMFEDMSRLRAFLHERMYRHYKVNRTRSQARRVLGELFKLFLAEPEVLPDEWQAKVKGLEEAGRARVVCDYIAGLTDSSALEEHRRLFHLDSGYGR